jgi:hypothetical protein
MSSSIFNFDGGRCRTCRQHPQRAAVDVCLNLVPVARIFLATPTRGATTVNITTTSKATSRKSEGKSFAKIFFGSLRC